MKIGIIGVGFVGSAVRHGLTRIGHDISVFDIKMPETKLEDVLQTELLFISVPTPCADDGACDVSIVEKVVADLASKNYKGLVTIKSTVEPGTTHRLADTYPHLRLAFCPEFLRERAAYVDFVENNDVCVIGASTPEDAELVRVAHGTLPKAFAVVSTTEAELAKYFSNVFNALRIVFANQFYDVAKAAGADYNKVKNAMVLHRNIDDVYLDSNENFRGFGGTCLPKDTKAFAKYAKKVLATGDKTLFDVIVETNAKYKTTVI